MYMYIHHGPYKTSGVYICTAKITYTLSIQHVSLHTYMYIISAAFADLKVSAYTNLCCELVNGFRGDAPASQRS